MKRARRRLWLTVPLVVSAYAIHKTQTQSPQGPPQQAVVREKEIIREIVKMKCRYCGNLYDQKENQCPKCGGHA